LATEKQIRANRANAQKSTGPRTAAGRLKSSRNAVRHNLSIALPADAATTNAMVQMLIGQDSEDQLAAATEIVLAQQELLRIRNVRSLMAAKLHGLASLDVASLRRLAALDRYERLALTRRRRAYRRLQK
jgi:hypothetical protein